MKTELFYKWPFYKDPKMYIAGQVIYLNDFHNATHCVIACFEREYVPYFIHLN